MRPKVFQKLGLAEDISKLGRAYRAGAAVLTVSGRILGRMSGAEIEKEHGYPVVALHRAALAELLSHHSPCPNYGHSFERYEQQADGVEVFFTDGSSTRGDILIGADGIRSRVREQMFGEAKLRHSGQTCWRFVTEHPASLELPYDMLEIWGNQPGLRAGLGRINSTHYYVFVTARTQESKGKELNSKARLRQLCQGFPSPVEQLLESTPEEAILCHDLYDLKPMKRWSEGRVVLVGDACHATTPNLGQGACQAVESAYALARCLKREPNFRSAFSRYQSLRISKAHYVTETSWRVGQMVNMEGKLARWVRDLTMSWTPDWVNGKLQNRLYNIATV